MEPEGSVVVHDLACQTLLYFYRRFSVMPVGRVEDQPPAPGNRRMSIIPRAQHQPAQGVRKQTHPLGFQEFDI